MGWATISSLQRPGQLAGEDDLLLVAAGQGRGGVSMDDVRTSNSSTRSSRSPDAVEVEGHAAGERLAVVEVEDEVLRDREAADQSVVQPVLGHIADAQPDHGVDPGPGDVVALEVTVPDSTFSSPTRASVSSVCPLPCTPARRRSRRPAPRS